jgi:hypothetical protein
MARPDELLARHYVLAVENANQVRMSGSERAELLAGCRRSGGVHCPCPLLVSCHAARNRLLLTDTGKKTRVRPDGEKAD